MMNHKLYYQLVHGTSPVHIQKVHIRAKSEPGEAVGASVGRFTSSRYSSCYSNIIVIIMIIIYL